MGEQLFQLQADEVRLAHDGAQVDDLSPALLQGDRQFIAGSATGVAAAQASLAKRQVQGLAGFCMAGSSMLSQRQVVWSSAHTGVAFGQELRVESERPYTILAECFGAVRAHVLAHALRVLGRDRYTRPPTLTNVRHRAGSVLGVARAIATGSSS